MYYRITFVAIFLLLTIVVDKTIGYEKVDPDGLMSPEEATKVEKLLKELEKETKRELNKEFSRSRKLLAKPLVSPPSPRVPMDEEKINEASGKDRILYEGDIIMTSSELASQIASKRKRRNAKKDSYFPKTLWDPSHVPYYFDDSLPPLTRTRVLEVMEYLEQQTCIRFRQNRTAQPVIKIYEPASGCASNIGKLWVDKEQVIALAKDCALHFGIIVHEVMHSLGFYHEQARMDRGVYVTINANNLQTDKMNNFNVQNRFTSDNQNFAYEYGSVMHYGTSAFAKDYSQPVLTSLDPLYQQTMGQRAEASFQDIQEINTLYQCGKCGGSTVCRNGGYPNPNLCSQCLCPHGFGGPSCEGLQPATPLNAIKGCGGIHKAVANEWSPLAGEVVNTLEVPEYDWKSESCWWRIEAEPGMKIALHFDSIDSQCTVSCSYNSIELKMGRMNNTGYIICCDEDMKNDYRSTGNLVVIGARSRTGTTKFALRYIAF